MTTSHTNHDHHDHSKMEHDQHMDVKPDLHASDASHVVVAESQHDMHMGHISYADNAVHGMDKSGGHAQHVDHSGHEDIFRKRFWISLLLSIPVLLYTPMLQMWFGFIMPEFLGVQWLTPLFAVIVFVYGGVPFIQMAVPEVRNRQPGMMTLISLAISVSFIYSLATTFVNLGEGFFWELVTLIDIMLLGHWIEMRSVRQASGALNILAKLIGKIDARYCGTCYA